MDIVEAAPEIVEAAKPNDLRGLTPEHWRCIDCDVNTAHGLALRVTADMKRTLLAYTAIACLFGGLAHAETLTTEAKLALMVQCAVPAKQIYPAFHAEFIDDGVGGYADIWGSTRSNPVFKACLTAGGWLQQ